MGISGSGNSLQVDGAVFDPHAQALAAEVGIAGCAGAGDVDQCHRGLPTCSVLITSMALASIMSTESEYCEPT